MTESLRGYDVWLTTEPEPWSYGECDVCGEEMHDEHLIWRTWNPSREVIGHSDCVADEVHCCHGCRKARCVCP